MGSEIAKPFEGGAITFGVGDVGVGLTWQARGVILAALPLTTRAGEVASPAVACSPCFCLCLSSKYISRVKGMISRGRMAGGPALQGACSSPSFWIGSRQLFPPSSTGSAQSSVFSADSRVFSADLRFTCCLKATNGI